MIQEIDAKHGLPDRQLVVLISSLVSGLGGSDPKAIVSNFFPEAG